MARESGWNQLMMLDRRAAELARGLGGTMLLLGELLGEMATRGTHHALGFSSLGAYVQERCDQSPRWARDVMRIAGDLGKWPRLRRALLAGEVTWSAAEVVLRALGPLAIGEAVLAPHVLEAAEDRWLHLARRHTVRELRAAVKSALVAQREHGGALEYGVGQAHEHGATSKRRGTCDVDEHHGADEHCAPQKHNTVDSPGYAPRRAQPPVRGEPLADGELADGELADGELADGELADGELSHATCAERDIHPYLRRLPIHVLTLTVSTDTAWWLSCARLVYERSVSDCRSSGSHRGVRSTESFMLALLAEARVELEGGELGSDEAIERRGRYVDLLTEWREESERRCDAERPLLEEVRSSAGELSAVLAAAQPVTELDLDARVRELGRRLAHRDIELGRLAESLQKADAWRCLGFASEAHYVRERMGVGFSQWKSWRRVARQLGAFPALEAAVSAGQLGIEAASLVLRVISSANPRYGSGLTDGTEEQIRQRAALERAWLERAQHRTFKHLREEVQAAELACQQWQIPSLPPSEETMRRFLALQGRVQSGAVLFEQQSIDVPSPEAPPWKASCALDGAIPGRPIDGAVTAASSTSVAQPAFAGVTDRSVASQMSGAHGAFVSTTKQLAASQMSVASRAWLNLRSELREIFGGAFLPVPGEPDIRREPALCQTAHACRVRRGQVRLRLRLERDTLVEFRCLERLYRKQHSGNFLEFLCRHFLAVWAPTTLTDVKYARIYRRDAFTCTSPVCERHDVQPHHLKFRSVGGGEEDENLTSLCTWCHLEGVHGGRIRVAPPASAMHWRIGPHLEVRGREVVR